MEIVLRFTPFFASFGNEQHDLNAKYSSKNKIYIKGILN